MGLEISDENIVVSGMPDDVTRIIPFMAVASYRVLMGFDDDVTTLAAILIMNDKGIVASDGNRNVWTSAYEQVCKDHGLSVTVSDINGNSVADGYSETRRQLGLTNAPQLPDGVGSADVESVLAGVSDELTSMREGFINRLSAWSVGSEDR